MGEARRILFTLLVVGPFVLNLLIATDSVRVASINVQNYLIMDRWVDGRWKRDYPKPEKEKQRNADNNVTNHKKRPREAQKRSGRHQTLPNSPKSFPETFPGFPKPSPNPLQTLLNHSTNSMLYRNRCGNQFHRRNAKKSKGL